MPRVNSIDHVQLAMPGVLQFSVLGPDFIP